MLLRDGMNVYEICDKSRIVQDPIGGQFHGYPFRLTDRAMAEKFGRIVIQLYDSGVMEYLGDFFVICTSYLNCNIICSGALF